MRVGVDFDTCESHGLCAAIAPQVFEVRTDGCLHLLDATPPEGLRAALQAAADACPTGSIVVLDD